MAKLSVSTSKATAQTGDLNAFHKLPGYVLRRGLWAWIERSYVVGFHLSRLMVTIDGPAISAFTSIPCHLRPRIFDFNTYLAEERSRLSSR